jgi:hypothetical protein
MAIQILGGILGLTILLGGCATPRVPGGAGEVRGALQSIEIYVGSELGVPYRTIWRERLFASDQGVSIGLYWMLPGPGTHAAKIALRSPAGALHGEWEARFRAEAPGWFTFHPVAVPRGAEAKALAGLWQVEVVLDGAPVGRRTFTLEPSSIRLRTEDRVVIIQGADFPEVAAGDWTWLNRAAALESMKSAHATLGKVLRDELARRFPRVEGPRQGEGDPDATLLLRTNVTVSPNPDADARLALDVVHVPTRTTRTFHFRSSEGVELMGATRYRDHGIAATHLAFEAAASPDLLEFLVTTTKAVPE